MLLAKWSKRRLVFSGFVMAIQITTMAVSGRSPGYALDQSGNEDLQRGEPTEASNSNIPTGETSEKRSKPQLPNRMGCGSLESAAATHGLPLEFFRRLVWQESNCNPNSVSRAGALGIAQFMPGTARWRGLSNPFEPAEALDEAARWLRELSEQFGNLGLAAAAYNAGPRRVKDWIEGHGQLPNETRLYVRIITGRAAEEWIGASGELPRMEKMALATRDHTAEANAGMPPWGVQLISNSSQTNALSEYAQLQKRYHSVLSDREPTVIKIPLGGRGPSTWYFVRVAESSRGKAMQLCAKLRTLGGSCIVSRNQCANCTTKVGSEK
jgi:hypothetical protein